MRDMGQRLGRFIGHYRNTFFVPDKRNQQVVFSYKPKPGAEEAIYRLISDITISMKGCDYLRLPELVMNEVPVRLSDRELECVETLKRDLVVSLKGKEIDAVNAAALSGKLLQMAALSRTHIGQHGVYQPVECGQHPHCSNPSCFCRTWAEFAGWRFYVDMVWSHLEP